MDSDNSNSSDDNEECWVKEDREFEMLCGLALKRIILACNIRRSCHTSDRTGNIFINEVLNVMFLMTLAHGCSNRFVQEFFDHFREMIHRHFHIVLAAVLKMSAVKMSAGIIRPTTNYNDEVPKYILNNP
uniref:DUF8040 domain-containing protein n=1 Tax=Lactuca sativa TaxID=4236 RepID=A0A9R1UG23_LACSA|nr:hypothetical protein LSAT_V11C900492910 [Lactuca sativa]